MGMVVLVDSELRVSRMIRNGAGCCPVFDVRGMLKDFTRQI